MNLKVYQMILDLYAINLQSNGQIKKI